MSLATHVKDTPHLLRGTTLLGGGVILLSGALGGCRPDQAEGMGTSGGSPAEFAWMRPSEEYIAANSTGTNRYVDPPAEVNEDAGIIDSLLVSYSSADETLSWSITFGPQPDGGTGHVTEGFWLVLSDGPMPTSLGGETAQFIFDASGPTPVVTAYVYNGLGNGTSYLEGPGGSPPDPIMTSLVGSDVLAVDVVHSGDQTTMSFTVNAGVINAFVPSFSAPDLWQGVGFDERLGIWLHPATNVTTAYSDDGYLTDYAFERTGWFDGEDFTTPPRGGGGSCCLPDGTCVLLGEEDCLAAGGSPQGMTACDPDPCSPGDSPGACCLADGTCVELTRDECAAAGGEYLGDDTTCESVTCEEDEPTNCRFTGGGNIRPDEHSDNVYSFGGQAGAPTGSQPTPCGEWTHRQRRGPDGKWTFHAGTASAIEGTYIAYIECSDPGTCFPSGAPPSPVKQLDFGGVGSFRNIHQADFDASRHESLHWFDVHIEDLGEGGSHDAPPGCPPEGHAGGNADCACPDFYRITIRANEDPDSEVIYDEYNYLDGGNFQIHTPIDSGPCAKGRSDDDDSGDEEGDEGTQPVELPEPVDECAAGRPSALTMRYVGSSCLDSSHAQQGRQSICRGDAVMTPVVRIVAANRRNPRNSEAMVYFDGTVLLEDEFTIDAAAAGRRRLAGQTYVLVYDLSGELLQVVKFNTSCAQPLSLGDQFGSVVLEEYVAP